VKTVSTRRTRVLLVGDGKNPRVRRAIADLAPWISQHAQLAGTILAQREPLPKSGVDLVVLFGGDGAILAAAHRMRGGNAPCVGVRLGHFGFLAELEPETSREALARLFAGQGRVIERMMLDVEVMRGSRVIARDLALNEAVIQARTVSRMVAVELDVDDEAVATYRGDGLIVSTPTGSTAHSLAAGGPIVEADSRAILVTPLASHTLASRPLVLSATHRIGVRIASDRNRLAAVSFDGQRTVPVKSGDRVILRAAKEPFRMWSIVDRSFFATLKAKFQWSGSVLKDPELPRAR
jgi:NAD+ kinase